MEKLIYSIKRFFWLGAVFIFRIVLAKRNFKVSLLKGLYYNFNGGFTSDQVALYNLTKENKNEYLSEFDWYKSRKINHPNEYKLNNKIICSEMIKNFVNVPTTFLTMLNNEEIDLEEALDILKKEKSVFFKPISVGKGNGIFRVDYKDNKFYLDFKEVLESKIKEILQTKENYFVSKTILQADYLDNIYKYTSNTIRLITTRYNNDVKIVCAVQRIGTKNTIPVDNGSRGGIVANIDLKTGKLSAARSIHNNKMYKKHPDSGHKIEGVIIPNWDIIKNQMLETAKKLPDFKFIAWDILPTNDGVYVIEANNSSGVNIIQVFGGQRQKELGNFYRKHKIIK